MLTNKLTWWILGILLLVVAFLLGYQSGLNGGLNVGYNQAVNESKIFSLFGPRRAAAPVAAPAINANVATQAGVEAAAKAANPLLVKNPVGALTIKNPLR